MARLALPFYFRRIFASAAALRNCRGPAIIASNHPNSMMDAVLIGSICEKPLHFLIRSDMFNRPLFRWMLRRMNGIPIYRQSEEKEKLRQNSLTFDWCREVLHRNGIILIFVEGATELDWTLKPLKSGTARIVQHCLAKSTLRESLRILPIGLTYSNFDGISKTCYIREGKPIFPGRWEPASSDGLWKKLFNENLSKSLLPLAPQMPGIDPGIIGLWKILVSNVHQVSSDSTEALEYLKQSAAAIPSLPSAELEPFGAVNHSFLPIVRTGVYYSILKLLILIIPGIAGILLNGCCYFPLRSWCRKMTRGTIFFDSLFFSILLFLYPVYIILLSFILHLITPYPFYFWIVALPSTAFAATRAWVQAVGLYNYYTLDRSARDLPGQILNPD